MSKRCNDDSCDGSHCQRCGGHFLDFYTQARLCSSCEQEIEFERNPPKCEQCGKVNDCAGRYCNACMDQQIEEANMRAEANRETPLGEQIEESGEILDPIGGEWN